MSIINSTTALVGMPDDDPPPPTTPAAARAPRPFAATDALYASMADHAPAERRTVPIRSTSIPPELDGAMTIGVPGHVALALEVAVDQAVDLGHRAADASKLTTTELLRVVMRQDGQLESIEFACDTLLRDSTHSNSMRKALEMLRDVSRERTPLGAPSIAASRTRLRGVAEKIGGLIERGRRAGIAPELLDDLRDVLELATGGVDHG